MMRRLALTLLTLAVGTASLTALGGTAQAAEITSNPPVINYVEASPSTFYPTVRDGYRDGVGLAVSADPLFQDLSDTGVVQNWSIVVRNLAGGKVGQHTGSGVGGYDDPNGDWDVGGTWNWNGKNLSGRPVSAGTYKATITVTNTETQESTTAVRTLTAKRALVNLHATKSRYGYNTSSRVRHGNCQVTRAGWDFDRPNSLYLDCRGGDVTANYGFSLPANARSVTWHVSGSHGFGWSGHIYRWMTRGHLRARVSVKVTGWEAYSVRKVSVSYYHLVQR